MSQSTFLIGSLLVAFIAWTILRGTFPLYLADLGLGGAAKSGGGAGGAGGSSAIPGGSVNIGQITQVGSSATGGDLIGALSGGGAAGGFF